MYCKISQCKCFPVAQIHQKSLPLLCIWWCLKRQNWISSTFSVLGSAQPRLENWYLSWYLWHTHILLGTAAVLPPVPWTRKFREIRANQKLIWLFISPRFSSLWKNSKQIWNFCENHTTQCLLQRAENVWIYSNGIFVSTFGNRSEWLCD